MKQIMCLSKTKLFVVSILIVASSLIATIDVNLLASEIIKTSMQKGFSSNTKVHTHKGLKNIQDLKKNDRVVSYNSHGEQEEKPVTQIYKNKVSSYLIITTTDKKVIKVAPDQQFFDHEKKEWVKAKKLTLASIITKQGYEAVKLKKIQKIDESNDFYDISVKDNNNFCITSHGINVHNMSNEFRPVYGGLRNFASKYCAHHSYESAGKAFDTAKKSFHFLKLVTTSEPFFFGRKIFERLISTGLPQILGSCFNALHFMYMLQDSSGTAQPKDVIIHEKIQKIYLVKF